MNPSRLMPSLRRAGIMRNIEAFAGMAARRGTVASPNPQAQIRSIFTSRQFRDISQQVVRLPAAKAEALADSIAQRVFPKPDTSTLIPIPLLLSEDKPPKGFENFFPKDGKGPKSASKSSESSSTESNDNKSG
eukprot:CAMPEP_0181299322 /NCGR_PEP_ID=MMETSP1101-20121128/6282_1 /TAXON_ID=46948 /ORGANISM="Rhodomonas abbreviata, Strain Caron Lab Isolate" /LENGTH=132 /DNA_ID=CAMNT_0023404459 /DNA_START=190 /DNA_END=584 /DNA_ORIENTATION=+